MTGKNNRPAVGSSAAVEELAGSQSKYSGTAVEPSSGDAAEPTADGGVSEPKRQYDPSFKPTSKDTLVERATRDYLMLIGGGDISLAQIRDGLLRYINDAISKEASARWQKIAKAPKLGTIESLDEITVVRVMLARGRIVTIDLTEGDGSDDLTLLAMYQGEGPEEGVYLDDEKPLRRMISALRPSSTENSVKSMLKLLATLAPRVSRTVDADLVPVANGVFDHARQELLPFSPDLVFLSKSRIDYDPCAESPVITMPDGEEWDFDSWLASLSDDEGVPELLWEVIGAALRAQAPWNKTVMLAGPEGNGGKGTYVQMLRNLIGPSACSAVKIVQFGERFGKTPLLRARVNLVDENPVGAFNEDASDWKSAITGDAISLERKFKDPVAMRWRGFEVQCLNTLTPKMKDKSASLKRRLLIVPMTKSFEGIERKYIKDDYLARPDVLRYVMRRALEMQHAELSNPEACREALENWYGANNRVVGFWREFEERFAWDLLPYAFLYDLYQSWYRATEPSGNVEAYHGFIEALKTHLGRSDRWELPAGSVRPKRMLISPEPLIGEYELDKWANSTYTGKNHMAIGSFDRPAANYRGVLRVQPSALAAAGITASGPLAPAPID